MTVGTEDLEQLRAEARRYRWFKEALQRAYDGSALEFNEGGLTINCSMDFGRKNYRRVTANISFGDDRNSDELGLDAAIDEAMAEEPERGA